MREAKLCIKYRLESQILPAEQKSRGGKIGGSANATQHFPARLRRRLLFLMAVEKRLGYTLCSCGHGRRVTADQKHGISRSVKNVERTEASLVIHPTRARKISQREGRDKTGRRVRRDAYREVRQAGTKLGKVVSRRWSSQDEKREKKGKKASIRSANLLDLQMLHQDGRPAEERIGGGGGEIRVIRSQLGDLFGAKEGRGEVKPGDKKHC